MNGTGLRTDHFDVRRIAGAEIFRLPAVIRGRVRMPVWPGIRAIGAARSVTAPAVLGPTDQDTYLITHPIVDRQLLTPTGDIQIIVVPSPDPHELVEPDPAAAIIELMNMRLDDVCQFIDAVGECLPIRSSAVTNTQRLLSQISHDNDRIQNAFGDQLSRMFDGAALRRMVMNELGTAGMRRLDGWDNGFVQRAPAIQGITAGVAANAPDLRAPLVPRSSPSIRGVPTTQLHITSGNMPIVLVTSLLWAWSTKGACVLKPAADSVALIAAIGTALSEVDPKHPLARHTTLAYWRGGDRRIEDILLRDGTFDRRILWGTHHALEALIKRGDWADTIVMRPRHGISVLGRTAVTHDLEASARRAAIDSVVANQQACMSSLLHIVEGSESEADAYARKLSVTLAQWDLTVPYRAPKSVQSGVLSIRRGLLASADWYHRGQWPTCTTAVARIDRSFDLSRHPGGRVVLVRAVDDVASAVADHVNHETSHVGVAPAPLLLELRDVLVAHGVDNVLPLGEIERLYAGRPHDGMQVLNRLIRWVTA